MKRTGIAVAFVLNVACCTGALAAPPVVKHLFPPGAQRGVTTELTATGDFSSWPVKAWASDPRLNVTCGEEKGKLNVTLQSDTRPGFYIIRLYNNEGASPPLPFVVGNLVEIVEKSPNDSPDKAQDLPTSTVTVNGRLEKREDVDVYAFELKEGQTLVASVVANETLASPMDAVLQILSADGSVLAQNDDWHGLDPQLVFTAPGAGKYLARIFAFPAQPDSRIGLAGGDDYLYRLSITAGPFIDHTWPLAVRQEETRQVELVGWNIDEQSKQQTVTAAEPVFVFSGDNLAGQLSLAVETHACPIEAEPNGPDQPQPIELPTTVSGRLQGDSDSDVYRFQAKQGETLLFRFDGRELGSPLDAVLEVTDSSGKLLTRMDDDGRRRDPELSWKAPEGGNYQIAVSDLHGYGGERFFYRLRAALAKPDFRIKSPEHAFVGTVGKPLEIKLEIDRQHGFDREIVIQPEGLPNTIVAEPVTSAAGSDSAKTLMLKLNASEPYTGPCRIVAAAKAPEPVGHAASFTLAGEAEITDFWLTIKPDKSD